MIVYHDVLPNSLGRVMYRIKNEYRRFAPDWVTFTADPKLADIQILDSIGTMSIPYIYCKNHILLQHCFKASDMSDENFWHPYWSNAKLVVSFSDIPSQVSFTDFNFLRLPIGVNPNVFYPENVSKRYMAMTTGYIAESECIGETLAAVQQTHNFMAHVGGDVFRGEKGYENYHDIEDSLMRKLYSQSYYTMGMRKGEGFEAPLLEGLLSGSRGVTLDYPSYRYWFGNHVEYIKDGNFDFVKDQLVELFSRGTYRVVTPTEQEEIKNKFSWSVVAKTFWDRVKELL